MTERIDEPEDAITTTMATYAQYYQLYYISLPDVMPEGLQQHLDQLISLTGPGTKVLELGSGTPRDAQYLIDAGLNVECSDITPGFIADLRAAGLTVRELNLLTADDYGGPYGAIFASAVLLHFTRSQVEHILRTARASLEHPGILAFSVINGGGHRWTSRTFGKPRWFRLWEMPEMVELLDECGFEALSLVIDNGGWLNVTAQASS